MPKKIRQNTLLTEIDEYLKIDTVVNMLGDTLSSEDYDDLTPIEREFAFRCATEYRSQGEWAKIFNKSVAIIARMQKDPRIVELVTQIKLDFRKFIAAKNMVLLEKALDQYNEIFNKRITDKNIESKRRAANDIMTFFKKDSGEDKAPTVQMFFNGQDSSESLETDIESVDISALNSRLSELKQIGNQVVRYGDKSDVRGDNDGF